MITGIVTTIFPADINTDDIIPAWTLQESTDRSFFGKHAFANYDPEFINRCKKTDSNIIVAGKNFGCGSSREQAVYALSENNVVAVITESTPDIFYRNCLNNGLMVLIVDNIKEFKLGEKLIIDLDNKIIQSGNKKFAIKNPDEDLKTFSLGGKIGKIRQHLDKILQYDRCRGRRASRQRAAISPAKPVVSTDGRESETESVISSKPQTMVEKIVSQHVGKTVFAGDKIDALPIDILYFNEVIGPPAIKDFYSHFEDVFKKNKIKPKVFDPKKIFFIPDHTVPSSSVAVSEGIDLMEEFSSKQGIKCYKEGDGIEHVLMIEDGYTTPGKIILGTDSHTDTNGAYNCLAFGIGTTDGAYVMATGYLYDFTVPETIRFNLKGKFKKGVYGKDLILYLIGKLGVDGASKKIIEFGGEGLKNISLDARTTIANMGVEMGARTVIFEGDEVLEKTLSSNTYVICNPDSGCQYVKVVNVDLSSLEPCVAFPHKPSNVKFISKITEKVKITDAFLGACTNGRYEDFVEAAKILKGRKIHKNVSFVAIPASRKIYNRLLKEGIFQIFSEAGVNIESSNCGPCFGKHMGVVGRGAQMISSSNRNYIGRMGSKDAHIFLASPVTVAASAVAGEIVDPRKYL